MKQFLEVLHDQKNNTLSHEQRNPEIKSVVCDVQPVSTWHTKKWVPAQLVRLSNVSVISEALSINASSENGEMKAEFSFFCMQTDFVSFPCE